MTFLEYIKQKEKIILENKEIEAIKILIANALNINYNQIYLVYSKEIPGHMHLMLERQVYQYLKKDIPVQYIVGYTYFYGLKYIVNKNVLIPRFDTEVVVEKTIELINKKYQNDKINILDIGTGSGCIAISLKKNIINSEVTASDVSRKALNVAKKNAKMNNVEINFIESDVFNNINDKYDVIISNPPYISCNTKLDNIVLNEPRSALFASDNGLYFYKKILKETKNYLKENGTIIFEIGYDQADEVVNLTKSYYPNSKILVVKDLSQNNRVVIIEQ